MDPLRKDELGKVRLQFERLRRNYDRAVRDMTSTYLS